MNFFEHLITFWQKPFPKPKSWVGLSKHIITISVVMTLFLYIFQPSGISDVSDKLLLCLGFGITGALSYLIYEVVFKQLTKLKKERIDWTFGKWLLYSIGVLFFISLGNFLFVRYMYFGYMKWEMFPYMIRGVFMFGIPVLSVVTLILLRDEKKYQAIAEAINQQTTTTIIPSKDLVLFDIPIGQIKYIEALQNYVTIGFINSSGQWKTKTERATLKSILEKTGKSAIVKTHRSFLVNRQAITKTEGNSQGLLLTLSDCDKQIPVSRSYVPSFKSA